jgi:hypothetical protein
MSDFSATPDEPALLREAMGILDAWDVPYDEQPSLLGLPDRLRRRDYNKYRLGTRRPDDPDVLKRARLICRIHAATLTIFPFSEQSANLWVQVPQRPFGGKSALDMMRLHGLEGIRQVELAVDNQFYPLENVAP